MSRTAVWLKRCPSKIENNSSGWWIFNRAGWKGGEGYQDVNYSLVGCSLVHSWTIKDARADRAELICYGWHLSLCLASLSRSLVEVTCHVTSVASGPVSVHFFTIYLRYLFVGKALQRQWWNVKKKKSCSIEYIVTQFSACTQFNVFRFLAFYGSIVSDPPPSANARRKYTQKSSMLSILKPDFLL